MNWYLTSYLSNGPDDDGPDDEDEPVQDDPNQPVG